MKRLKENAAIFQKARTEPGGKHTELLKLAVRKGCKKTENPFSYINNCCHGRATGDHLNHLAHQDVPNYTHISSHPFLSYPLKYSAIKHGKAGSHTSSCPYHKQLTELKNLLPTESPTLFLQQSEYFFLQPTPCVELAVTEQHALPPLTEAESIQHQS